MGAIPALELDDAPTAEVLCRCTRCGYEARIIATAEPPPVHVMLDVCMRSKYVVRPGDERPRWEYCSHPDVREFAVRLEPMAP